MRVRHLLVGLALAAVAPAQMAWMQRAGGGPSARTDHATAYDSVRGRIVLFGGQDTNCQDLADTWEFDGVLWIQCRPLYPPPGRYGHAMTFDAARGRTVLFGGMTGLNDTWEWDGTSWLLFQMPVNPGPGFPPLLAWDSARQRSVLWNGTTWEWDGTSWRQRAVVISDTWTWDRPVPFPAQAAR